MKDEPELRTINEMAEAIKILWQHVKELETK